MVVRETIFTWLPLQNLLHLNLVAVFGELTVRQYIVGFDLSNCQVEL